MRNFLRAAPNAPNGAAARETAASDEPMNSRLLI
jgi:hypothetical protein